MHEEVPGARASDSVSLAGQDLYRAEVASVRRRLGMVFQDGAIVEPGPTAAIFSTPRDERTEQYVMGRFG